MHVKVLKRLFIPISSDTHDTIVQKCVKFVTIGTSLQKTNSPWKVSSPIFTSSSDSIIFKQKHFLKSTISVRAVNKGKDNQNNFVKKHSKGSNTKCE